MSDLVNMIANSTTERAVQIDAALCKLIIKGGRELGALEPAAAVGIDGNYREIKLPPQLWLDRLARAVQVGAFDRMTVTDIVDRIIMDPPPTA